MASKKGGGKSQLLWIGAIAGLLLLAWLTLNKGAGYGGAVDSNGSDASTQNQVKATPATQNKAAVGGTATNNNSSYNLSAKEGGELGGSYLLKNISTSRTSGYESANIFVRSISGTTATPKYDASISGNTIYLTLSDSKNWDIDASAPSYDAENPLTINGKIIKTVQWVAKGEDSLIIKINLKSQSPFSVVTKSNPLTLEVRIQI